MEMGWESGCGCARIHMVQVHGKCYVTLLLKYTTICTQNSVLPRQYPQWLKHKGCTEYTQNIHSTSLWTSGFILTVSHIIHSLFLCLMLNFISFFTRPRCYYFTDPSRTTTTSSQMTAPFSLPCPWPSLNSSLCPLLLGQCMWYESLPQEGRDLLSEEGVLPGPMSLCL